MRNRPGDSGLVARLDSLQHQINELSRRSGRGPLCVVTLGATVATPAVTDVIINSSWNANADTDTDGMWQYTPQGGEPSHLRIPVQGRYLLVFHQRWGYYPPSNPYGTAVLSAKILRNSTVVAGHAIGSSAVQAAQFGEGTTVDALTMWPRLDVGDKIYFLVYSQHTWSVLPTDVNGNSTWIGAYYLGPT